MTLEELIESLRLDYLDDGVETYRWSNEQLTRWINQAQNDACRRQRLLVDKTSSIASVTLTAGTANYTLSPLVHMVDEVRFNGEVVPKYDAETLDDVLPGWNDLDPGEPIGYMQNARTLTLIPTPATSQDGGTLSLTVWRLPLTTLEDDDDEPEIDPGYHEDLCHYAAAKAYRMPDEDLRDTHLAEFHEAEFDRAFGPRISADVMAHKRRHGNVTSIRPGHAYQGRKSTLTGHDPFDYT